MTRWIPGALAAAAIALGSVLVCRPTSAQTAHAPGSTVPAVVASIAPIHSLVAGVMEGLGQPRLLVPGSRSPHAFSLRPSDARSIQSADLVVWVGPGLESFLARPLESLAVRGGVLRLSDAPGLELLPLREPGGESPDEDHRAHAHDHESGSGHRHGVEDAMAGVDMHLWLDPRNASRVVERVAEVLAGIDSANADVYRRNAAALRERLAALDERIAGQLAPVARRDYIVFHDGYRYFEHRYGLRRPGVLTVNPEVSPGADRVRRMRARIAEGGVGCVFIEPQFPAAIAETLVEGTGARIGRLDPLGAGLEPGTELYPRLLSDMAASFADCLAGAG